MWVLTDPFAILLSSPGNPVPNFYPLPSALFPNLNTTTSVYSNTDLGRATSLGDYNLSSTSRSQPEFTPQPPAAVVGGIAIGYPVGAFAQQLPAQPIGQPSVYQQHPYSLQPMYTQPPPGGHPLGYGQLQGQQVGGKRQTMFNLVDAYGGM